MKFGKQLEEYELPEWRGHYIPYTLLKKKLEKLKADSSETAEEQDWLESVKTEALRVGDFVNRCSHGIEEQLKELTKMAEDNRVESGGTDEVQRSVSQKEETTDIELRIVEATGRVTDGMRRLKGFAELNHAALYKILKKHDKLLGNKIGLREMFPDLVEKSGLGNASRFESLDEELKKVSHMNSVVEGLEASPEVARLVAGFGIHGRDPGGNQDVLLCFFVGASFAFLTSIILLLTLPEEEPQSFSTAYFLTPMPVFRVVFSVALVLWCLGLVARTCDTMDINHMFILRVDPRCRISPDWFFTRAAVLTFLWILTFGAYVVDYKWQVLPPIWSNKGYNDRASVHFVLYPLVLLLCTIVGMVWPSRVCRRRYQGSLLKSLGRTMASPLYPVDFADNIVGDVLTSIAKPLQDVPDAVCYLLSPHPQTVNMVQRFTESGTTCSATTHMMVIPIIGGLPYLIRAFQCVRRYCDTKDARHLWNLGKYTSCLLVVVVSSFFNADFYTTFALAAISTAYCGFWDLKIDWGLSKREYFGNVIQVEPQDASASLGSKDIRMSRKMSKDMGVTDVLIETDRVKPAHVDRPPRHFSARTYMICSVFDMLARCTWVQTLMPVSTFTSSISRRVILVSVISSTEIIRRSVWAVLRIENEQVANASGFRALLWVPSKIHMDDDKPGSAGLKRGKTVVSSSANAEPLLA